jgi:beta-glucanase (GH16 family)
MMVVYRMLAGRRGDGRNSLLSKCLRSTAAAFFCCSSAALAQGWVLQDDLSDEFDYPEGTSIDTVNRWHFQTDAHFNGEVQQYTDWQCNVPEGEHLDDYNIRTTGSTIEIVARNDGGEITSGRINSQCKMAFTYGRIEFRLKAPESTRSGLWPAVWMLGNRINQSPRCPSAGEAQGWPACGEIDLWEYQSRYPDSYITNGFCGSGCDNARRVDIRPGMQAGEWIIFCALWTDSVFSYWYRNDGEPFDTVRGLVTKNNRDCQCFKSDMFYLINLAVGGNLGGPVENPFPQTMELDYIRTYTWSDDLAVRPTKQESGQHAAGHAGWTGGGAQKDPGRRLVYTMQGRRVAEIAPGIRRERGRGREGKYAGIPARHGILIVIDDESCPQKIMRFRTASLP